jgi:hypothetical protein
MIPARSEAGIPFIRFRIWKGWRKPARPLVNRPVVDGVWFGKEISRQ